MIQINKETIYKLRSLIGLFLFIIILSMLSPRFFSLSNFMNILRQTSLNAIIAVGMTFVIITAGIDLSVGSIYAFSAAITAQLLISQVSIWLAIPLGLLTGTFIGTVNGLFIAKGKFPPFITTLAMMTIVRGWTLVFTDGRPITGLGDAFYTIGGGYCLGVPIPVILTILIFLFASLLLTKYRIGRYIYAIGANEEAARLSGINVNWVKTIAYSISGFLSALSGIIIASRLNSARPNAGTGAELDAIAAVVLGGTSLSGGKGKIMGTLVGALIIGILNNGLNILNVSPYYQLIAKGAVILLAISFDKKDG